MSQHDSCLPRAGDELEIPLCCFRAGWPIARSLVAAMALAPEAMNMGTRFIRYQEAPVHENVIKQAIVAAPSWDTRLVMRSLRHETGV